jgi:hypothetical protein
VAYAETTDLVKGLNEKRNSVVPSIGRGRDGQRPDEDVDAGSEEGSNATTWAGAIRQLISEADRRNKK